MWAAQKQLFSSALPLEWQSCGCQCCRKSNLQIQSGFKCLSWRSGTERAHPHPHCSSCPRTLFQSSSLPRVGAFVSLLNEGNVSQDICSTQELFRSLKSQHMNIAVEALETLWERHFCYLFTLDPGAQAVMLQPCHLFPVLQACSSPLSTWACGSWNSIWIGVIFSPKVKASPLTPRASEVTFCYFRNSTRLYLL